MGVSSLYFADSTPTRSPLSLAKLLRGKLDRSLAANWSFSGVNLSRDSVGGNVVVLLLGLVDLNNVGHDFSVLANSNLSVLHDLDLDSEDTLAELDVADGNIDELELGLTGGDDVALLVLLGLCALATDLSGDDDLATDGTTASHD